MINQRLQELGIELPPGFPPAGNYLGCVVDNDLVYVGGHVPINGDNVIRGRWAATSPWKREGRRRD